MPGFSRSSQAGTEEVAVDALQALRKLEEGETLVAGRELEYRGVRLEGGLSLVLQVLDRSTDALLALKVIRPELVADEAALGAFVSGCERAASVGGDFPTKIVGVGFLRSVAGRDVSPARYLLHLWVEGRSLREMLAFGGQGLPPDRAFHAALLATRAVTDLHRAGVMHGDIRPEHFLMTKQNQMRVIDFAIAPQLRRRAEALSGVPWASLRYAPPELSEGGEHASWASDVYQLAVMTYELFAGAPCSPWVGYEELCEIVDCVPPELDEVIQVSLAPAEHRPSDAEHFFNALREAEYTFRENQRTSRLRVERKPKDLWAQALALAERSTPLWGHIAALTERALEEKPSRLPFGRLPAKAVEDLFSRACGELQAARRRHLDVLLGQREFAGAAAYLEQLSEEVTPSEHADLRYTFELARLAAQRDDPRARGEAAKHLVELLRDPGMSPSHRAVATRLLEELMQAAKEEPVAPELRPAFVSELGELPAVERWRVTTGEDVASFRVVVGPAMRMGRGSYEEFGNHLDLRPTKREAGEDSTKLALAQTLSRAGHLELRVGPDGLEAFCMGTHGAKVDQTPLKRGERAILREEGECSLAQGATSFTYHMLPAGAEPPLVVELRFCAGVGAGRRAFWVLRALPSEVLVPAAGKGATFEPGPTGWTVEAARDGVFLGDERVGSGAGVPWPDDVAVRLSDTVSIERG